MRKRGKERRPRPPPRSSTTAPCPAEDPRHSEARGKEKKKRNEAERSLLAKRVGKRLETVRGDASKIGEPARERPSKRQDRNERRGADSGRLARGEGRQEQESQPGDADRAREKHRGLPQGVSPALPP